MYPILSLYQTLLIIPSGFEVRFGLIFRKLRFYSKQNLVCHTLVFFSERMDA